MKASLIAAAIAAIGCGAVVVYVVEKPPEVQPTSAVQSSATDAIPTPQYLFDHPDMLKDGEQKCQHNSDPSSLYCTNVQRAESLRLADKYRRAVQPKGAAQ